MDMMKTQIHSLKANFAWICPLPESVKMAAAPVWKQFPRCFSYFLHGFSCKTQAGSVKCR